MSANHRVVFAVIEADRSPDWAAGEAFVDAFAFEQLEELLESPATLSFHEFGAGLERVRQELREDLGLLRRALASGHDDLATFTTHGLAVCASYEDTPAGDLFLSMSRLRWSGALAALGFRPPGRALAWTASEMCRLARPPRQVAGACRGGCTPIRRYSTSASCASPSVRADSPTGPGTPH